MPTVGSAMYPLLSPYGVSQGDAFGQVLCSPVTNGLNKFGYRSTPRAAALWCPTSVHNISIL